MMTNGQFNITKVERSAKEVRSGIALVYSLATVEVEKTNIGHVKGGMRDSEMRCNGAGVT